MWWHVVSAVINGHIYFLFGFARVVRILNYSEKIYFTCIRLENILLHVIWLCQYLIWFLNLNCTHHYQHRCYCTAFKDSVRRHCIAFQVNSLHQHQSILKIFWSELLQVIYSIVCRLLFLYVFVYFNCLLSEIAFSSQSLSDPCLFLSLQCSSKQLDTWHSLKLFLMNSELLFAI